MRLLNRGSLDEDPHGNANERENAGPVEQEQEVVGLEGIGTDRKEQEEKSGDGGDDQILHLRQDVCQEAGHPTDQKVFAEPKHVAGRGS